MDDADLNSEHPFACPYCGAEVQLMVDLTGGHQQAFTFDCEVCCRPISIRLSVGPDGEIDLVADRES